MRQLVSAALAGAALAAGPAIEDVPVSLRGSPESMHRQNAIARETGLPFARTPAELRRIAARGQLVRVSGNADYDVREDIAAALARPELKGLVERVAAGYRRACGEQLVVTSLTRPANRQPPNAHPLSVHPAGIAVDLRVSARPSCRRWLERRLLALEGEGVLDVTREYLPPHYHVAVFPAAYRVEVEPPAADPSPVLALPAPSLSPGPAGR